MQINPCEFISQKSPPQYRSRWTDFQALSAIKHLVPKNVPVVAVSKAKGI